MRIYVVTSGDWSDYGIDQIFLTKEKADLYVSIHKGSRIEEHETYDDKIAEDDLYYVYSMEYIPEIDDFRVLPTQVEEYFNDVKKQEFWRHTSRRVVKKCIKLEYYQLTLIDKKRLNEEQLKKIFFDKLAVYKAKKEGIV